MATNITIGLAVAAVIVASLPRRCEHDARVWGRDTRRGWHRHCLECGYRSHGLTGWHWRDRAFDWMRRHA